MMESSKPLSSISTRKRKSSKGDQEEGPSKRLRSREPSVDEQKPICPSPAVGEASFADDIKKILDLTSSPGSIEALTTSTPISADCNLRRKRRKKSEVQLDLPLDQKGAAEVSGLSAELPDGKALDSSGLVSDDRPLERSGRRNKSTSARILLGLEKRKALEQDKDLKDVPLVVLEKIGSLKDNNSEATEKPRNPRRSRKSKSVSDAGFKTESPAASVKQECDELTAALEVGLPEISLSVEKCASVKPEWLKPFKQGWRREIVFRNTSKGALSSKQSSDIYYYSSNNTKLRSLPQIIDYLRTNKSNLTGECFTFKKSSIYKEPEELVRSAAFARGRGSTKTSLQNSNESSMKSFDDAADDISSQLSSVGPVSKHVPVKMRNKKTKLTTEISVKLEDSKSEVPEDFVAPEPTDESDKVTTKEPKASVIADSENKEEICPDLGDGQMSEVDKRKAVRAAATLALRTYMNHALRTVSNPLLQNKGTKSSEKVKSIASKSPSKGKSPVVKSKIQSPNPSHLPVVSLAKIGSIDEEIRHIAGGLKAKTFEPARSLKPSPLSKVAISKSKTLISNRILPERVKVRMKKTPILKKPSPPSSSTSQELSGVALKDLIIRKDCEVSLSRLSKPVLDNSVLVKSSKSKQLTPTILKIPKSDIKSSEKPVTVVERRLSAPPICPKPLDCIPPAVSRICGMDCAGRLGIPPSLLCATCMCTYHPECAGYISQMYLSSQMDFTCWNCRKLNKELEDTNYVFDKYKFPSLEDASSPEISADVAGNKKHPDSTEASSSAGSKPSSDSHAPEILKSSEILQNGLTATPVKSQVSADTGQGGITGDVTPSSPTAQLLVLPVGIKQFLNLSMTLTLVVEDQELRVEPDQLKTSSVGVNIRLPVGTLPDTFVQGPECPLEFRVVSSASSGRQVISVTLYKWPRDSETRKISASLRAESDADLKSTASPKQLCEKLSAVDPDGNASKNDIGSDLTLTSRQDDEPKVIESGAVSADIKEIEKDESISTSGAKSGSETGVLVVAVSSDESLLEVRKRNVSTTENEIPLEGSHETSVKGDSKEVPFAAKSDAVNCGTPVLPTQQSSDEVNASVEQANVPGSTEVAVAAKTEQL